MNRLLFILASHFSQILANVPSGAFLKPEDFALAAKMPVEIPPLSKINAGFNPKLLDGDILSTVSAPPGNQLHPRALATDGTFTGTVQRNGLINAHYRWPNARVPYVLEADLTSYERAVIAQAVEEYNAKTCIRFVPKTDSDRDYISIQKTGATGCNSYVGRIGGSQTVNLAGNCFYKGTVVHELMHAVGFEHEQSRTDRDDYVQINYENILDEFKFAFDKYPANYIDPFGMGYDYASVMHYDRRAFSKNGGDTILPKARRVTIGQRAGLSAIDAIKINKMYHCA